MGVELFPSDVAVICALPAASAATCPDALTVATAAFEDCQLTRRAVIGSPWLPFGVAVSCAEPPTVRFKEPDGLTSTVAIASGVSTIVLPPHAEARRTARTASVFATTV
jgi:hypothetical protein